ncbi:MAG: TonB-dependent receptor plug domain-containing protein [Candidatus Marinimicrobia bacterium]|nr:TonB-dependent receptor plug domain-containing protein [Candidatus Neomarinimicrobiota bacterium]MDP6610933.1 TonB-dependent receptor plug domain-containing protein [Candidatus Neomarinimicrobiota bacterium]
MSRILPLIFLMIAAWGGTPQVIGFIRNGETLVANAIIIHQSSGTWAVSDEYGFFNSIGSAGDSIFVYHYGFKPYRSVIPAHNKFFIQLNIDPLELDLIQVTGDRQIQVNHFQSKPGRNLASTMETIPSLTLRTYGGLGGLGTVSIDGGLTSHTKILLNGVDLTSPQNGETDLSQIPVFLFDQITIARTPALSHGSGSIDGSIAINSFKSSRIDVTAGSFGRQSLAGQINIPTKDWNTQAGLGKLRSKGDFPYNQDGNTGRIGNNKFEQNFFSFGTNRAISQNWFVSIQSLITEQDRGIPGLVFSPSSEAHRKDELHLFNIKSIWQLPKHLFSISITSRNSDERYTNPQYAVDSKHKLESSQMDLKWMTSPLESIEINQKISLKKEAISSTNTDSINRIIHSYANTLRWTLSQNITNENGFRFDQEKGGFSTRTWQSGFEYYLRNGSLSIMGGNGFRYPTFNDLYWNPGGNPSLFPERTNWARIHWNTDFMGHHLSIRASSKSSRNLIQWAPGENFWQPQNIAKARRNTLTFTASGSLIKPIRYSGHFSYNNTKDLTVNKRLRYAPDLLGTFSFETDSLFVNGWIQGRYVGQRIAMYSWPKDVIMEPFLILSGGINWTPYQAITILFSIENFLNKNYMTVNGYPEPGRSFSLTVQFKPQNKMKKS